MHIYKLFGLMHRDIRGGFARVFGILRAYIMCGFLHVIFKVVCCVGGMAYWWTATKHDMATLWSA